LQKKAIYVKQKQKRALELHNTITDQYQKEKKFANCFVRFKKVERSERIGINPKTGAKIKIASKKVVRFKPGNDLSGQVK
jgi:DNA-binding protein HU-beta